MRARGAFRGARLRALAGTVASVACAAAAMAATVTTVTQTGRAFSTRQVEVRAGDVVRFQNADSFIHHVYVHAAAMTFDSDEQEPGQTVDVLFAARGSFAVRCEIHPKMLLQVEVR